MIQVCNNKEKESYSAEETKRGCGGANQTPSTLKGKTRVARMWRGMKEGRRVAALYNHINCVFESHFSTF